MDFAIINNNIVENKIVATQEFADLLAQSNQFVVRIDNISDPVDIGYIYDEQNETFTSPQSQEGE